MESDNLGLLKNIKRVKVPDTLYQTIESRLEKNRENIIPLYKVGIAASLVIGLMLTQVYFLEGLSSKIDQSNNDFELVEINNNLLYYE
jgi:hypothetical protein